MLVVLFQSIYENYVFHSMDVPEYDYTKPNRKLYRDFKVTKVE